MNGGTQLAMVALFFVYGLAFFMMGFAILGEVRWATRSKLAVSLIFLALFGLLHGLVEWTDMFLYVVRGVGATGWEGGLEMLHSVLLPLSLVPLLIFGIKVLSDSLVGARWLWFLAPLLLGAWLVAGFLPLIVPSLTGGEGGLPDLMRWQETWARYLLYLPGSLLAALGLASHRRLFNLIGMGNIARYATLGAVAFALNSVVAGIIVPAAPFPPATWLNYDTFVGLVGVPPQLFRALAAGVMAFSVVQMLRFFELSQRRRLEEARQHARAEELAVIQERERLAREIHDSLAQALGYLRLEGSQVSQHLSEGALDAAREALERMDHMAEAAYADVRDAILGLRSTVLEGRSLVPTLRDYLNTFGLQHGLKTALKAGPGVEASLSPQVEVQLIRVVQEALANVRKHARATQAVVSLGVEGEGVRITVEDDGRGFDPQAVARRGGGHFGLSTMRERAESVGGWLKVESAPGAGTRLSLWVPRTPRRKGGLHEAAKNAGGG